MDTLRTVGIDLGKSAFQIHGVDAEGSVVLKRRLSRSKMFEFFKSISPCLVGIEATSGANHVARSLSMMGHTVKLMPASYVKPYVKTHKNDANDAEAICEAVQRPSMHFVPVKDEEQQAVLALHRARKLLAGQRVALSNALRSILVEFGVVVPARSSGISTAVQLVEGGNGLPRTCRTALRLIIDQHNAIGRQIERATKEIEAWHKRNASSQRLGTIPGIGALAASALVASVGDPKRFRSGRDLASWLGLVPRQHSSAGRSVLGRITKRGDTYIRGLLFLGAMSVLRVGSRSKYRVVRWAAELAKRKPYRLALVALANKLARIVWAVLSKGGNFIEPELGSSGAISAASR